MRKNCIFILALAGAVFSFSGCGSDSQNMSNGKAKEYQQRFNDCSISIESFSDYVGFGFVEET